MNVPGTVEPAARGPSHPFEPRSFRIVGRAEEAADTVSVDLEPLDGRPMPFAPGQFNMLWAFGVGESAISISGAFGSGETVRHTIRAVGAVTTALAEAPEGDVVGVRGPFGRGWDAASARGHDLVIVAGGIGLAPLRPLVHEVLADRGSYGEVSLLVGARSPADLLFVHEMAEWEAAGIRTVTTVDHARRGWGGNVGVVTELLDPDLGRQDQARAFVCGPEIMMRFTAERLIDLGIPPSQIRVSLERNMVCATRQCGHCQLGPTFICADGPVFEWSEVAPLLSVRQL